MSYITRTLIISALLIFLSACQSTSQQNQQPLDDEDITTSASQERENTPDEQVVLAEDFIPEFSNDNWRAESIALDSIVPNSPYENTISVTRFYFDEKYVDRINLTSGILFDVDSSELTREANIIVSSLIQNFMNQLQKQYVYIVGHTDSDGSASYNLNLSLQRATSVLQAMRQYDIPTGRLGLVPAGEHVPVVANTTLANKAINRRVEIYISPWEDMPLSLLRDWKCPGRVCDTVDLDILSVTRDFNVVSASRELANARTIRSMQTQRSNRQVEQTRTIREIASTATTREVAQQETVREVRNLQSIRNLPILNARYQVNSTDPDYLPLIERLQARGF